MLTEAIDGISFNLNDVTVTGVLIGIAVLVITDKLVWHKRLKAADARADRWERVALDALQTGTRAGVRAAEISSEVLSKLPEMPEDQ